MFSVYMDGLELGTAQVAKKYPTLHDKAELHILWLNMLSNFPGFELWCVDEQTKQQYMASDETGELIWEKVRVLFGPTPDQNF